MRKLSFLILIVLFAANAFALEKNTHKALNEAIVGSSGLSTYLTNQLGFPKGISEPFNNVKAVDWITAGGSAEDEPLFTRSLNHFHDPLKSWEQAGFLGSFSSSLIWAQDQGAFGSQFGGDFPWKKAREVYYLALTSSDPGAKELYYASMFRALGQVMHLVQDASVPAHVRNDSHARGDLYEFWVDADIKKILLNVTPIAIDPSIFNEAGPSTLAPIPISALWDQEKYQGYNPEVTQSPQIGLAEIVNANFLSAGTIFSGYPHPAVGNTTVSQKEVISEDGKVDKVWSYKGYLVENLATASYMKNWYQANPQLTFLLDFTVYADYANKLIPLAMGYSRALLDYFFRGELGVSQAIPLFTDNVLTELTVKVRNYTSTKEAISDGYFGLSYEYTKTDGTKGYGKAPYVVGMNNLGVVSLPYGKNDDGSDNAVEDLTITFGSLLPAGITTAEYESAKFTLAYFGDLGAEKALPPSGNGQIVVSGAVIGKVFKAGKILFNEEWDNGLTGNHPWYQSRWDCDTCWHPYVPTPDKGVIENTISNGYLQKDNNIYTYPFPDSTAMIQQSNITLLSSNDAEHNDVLPLSITKDTYMLLRFGETSQNQLLDFDFQALFLTFNNGYEIQLATAADYLWQWHDCLYFALPAGTFGFANIHKMFTEDYGIAVTDELKLTKIYFQQSMVYDTVPPAYTQQMLVDHIRFVNAKPESMEP